MRGQIGTGPSGDPGDGEAGDGPRRATTTSRRLDRPRCGGGRRPPGTSGLPRRAGRRARRPMSLRRSLTLAWFRHGEGWRRRRPAGARGGAACRPRDPTITSACRSRLGTPAATNPRANSVRRCRSTGHNTGARGSVACTPPWLMVSIKPSLSGCNRLRCLGVLKKRNESGMMPESTVMGRDDASVPRVALGAKGRQGWRGVTSRLTAETPMDTSTVAAMGPWTFRAPHPWADPAALSSIRTSARTETESIAVERKRILLVGYGLNLSGVGLDRFD